MATQFVFTVTHSYAASGDGRAVPVILRYGGRTASLLGFVDTGTTFCLFERGYGEALGLDVESGVRKELRTAAGRFLAFGHELTLSTIGIEMEANVYFFADAEIRKNVLGRRGWLDRVRLGVVDYEQVLYLAPYDNPAQ